MHTRQLTADTGTINTQVKAEKVFHLVKVVLTKVCSRISERYVSASSWGTEQHQFVAFESVLWNRSFELRFPIKCRVTLFFVGRRSLVEDRGLAPHSSYGFSLSHLSKVARPPHSGTDFAGARIHHNTRHKKSSVSWRRNTLE